MAKDLPIEQQRIKDAEVVHEEFVTPEPEDQCERMMQEPTYGFWMMLKGPYKGKHTLVSAEDMKLKADMADAVMHLGLAGVLDKKLAVIGAGTGYILRLLLAVGVTGFDCYEIRPALKGWNERREPKLRRRLNWIPGDYRETIHGNYDAILYDLGEDVLDEAKLREHLTRDGILYITE